MNERIVQLLEEIKMSPSLFADAIGVQRATISHILSGRNNPSLDFVQKVLLKFPELNPDWILSGKGEIWRKPMIQNVHTTERVTMKPSRNQSYQPELFSDFEAPQKPAGKVYVAEVQKAEKPYEINIGKDFQAGEAEIKSVVSSSNALNKKQITKVILLYDDGTFESYNS